MSTTADSAAKPVEAEGKSLRIGEVAELTGTTPRTIRYWEEVGLLGSESDREEGKHRWYARADVERVSEIVRLRNLLGLSLEQLSSLLEAESARAHLREELTHTEAPAKRKKLLEQVQEHIGTQLDLVHRRLAELQELSAELEDKQRRVAARIEEYAQTP